MAIDPKLDPAWVVEPISADLPCGEDLDEAADLDFLNAIARVEGALPSSFFVRDDEGKQQIFDRSTIDFGRETQRLLGLLERTRDLRVLTLLARLSMLNRDLPDFARVLSMVAALLETHWEAVHPRGESGKYELRAAVLQTLDDVPTVVLPLQHVVLFQHRRLGSISFRALMVADGEVPPRNEESRPDRAAIERALAEIDPDALKPLQAALAESAAAADKIAAITRAHGSKDTIVTLERLAGLVARMRALLSTVAVPLPQTAEPAATASEANDAPRQQQAGSITSAAAASAALAAATAYLRAHEPSSPAEVLVRQAQALVGKSFLDVMRILMPNQAPDATLVIGASRSLRLTFDQLAAVPSEGDDEYSSGGPAEPTASLPDMRVTTRAETFGLLREVGNYFRNSDPASPIPLLLEKAAGLSGRDFLSILKDCLPDHDVE